MRLLERLRRLTEKPPYEPRGAAAALRGVAAPEVVLSGPAGTGKTRGCLEWMHALALEHPRSRGLICRRTRDSLTQTALVTFNEEVRPHLDGAAWRATEQEYRYPNGSVVVVAGLDREGQRVFSSQYDHVYVNEATELQEAHWENLTTRLRNGRSPLQQLFADCNPDRPSHWLKVRSDEGRCLMLESRHEDNPRLWDGAAWTKQGVDYLAKLDALTGPRRLRLRFGRWVQAEGIVYDAWDAGVHLIDPFAIPPNWPRYWAVDFGYTNPFCCLMCAADGDGRLYVYRQVYHTKRLVKEHAERMRAVSVRDPSPAGIVADSEDREGRETLAAAGYGTVAALKGPGSVMMGIQAVQARLQRAGDGRPRLFVFRGGLDERDPELAQARRPTCLEEEIDGYVFDARAGRDGPAANQDDHALDALRYLVAALDAPRQRDEDDSTTTVYVT